MEVKRSSVPVMGPLHPHHHHSHHSHRARLSGGGGGAGNVVVASSNTNGHQAHHQPPISNCAACQKPIRERFLLKALDQLWHEDCLKCSCCDCRLGEVGSTLFTKANLILCKRDYLRLFGATGICSACNKMIPAFEMVMRVRGDRVYHLECFQCSHCNHRFCIGDRFHLYDNRILCEYDFEELLVFGNETTSGSVASSVPFNNNTNNNSHIEKLKKQTDSLASFPPAPSSGAGIQAPAAAGGAVAPQDDGSSGYGSPDSLLSDGR